MLNCLKKMTSILQIKENHWEQTKETASCLDIMKSWYYTSLRIVQMQSNNSPNWTKKMLSNRLINWKEMGQNTVSHIS